MRTKPLLLMSAIMLSGGPGGSPVWAGIGNLGAGARPWAMGGAFTALAEAPHGLFWNPAGLGRYRGLALGSSYHRLFNLAELSHGVLSTSWGGHRGGLGLSYGHFGTDRYRETVLLIGYGRRLAGPIFAGLGIRGQGLAITGYGTSFDWGIDGGILLQLPAQVTWGLSVINGNRPELGRTGQAIPWSWRNGMAWGERDRFWWTADLFKEPPYPAQLRIGHELWLASRLALRLGLYTRPSRFSAGCGVRFSRLRIDYAVITHLQLGSTHLFAVGWR